MKSNEPPSLVRLRSLLHDATTTPAEAARALLEERSRVVGKGALARELLTIEQRWLAAREEARDPTLAAHLGLAQRECLTHRVHGLAADPGDTATLFDLAEAKAEAVVVGAGDLVATCDRAIAEGLAKGRPAAAVDQEVTERFALLSSAIDDVSIAWQVQLLRCSGEVARALGKQVRSKAAARCGTRLLRAADDRELARRLEARVGPSGVTTIETANFVLLLVVLVSMLVEATVDLSPMQSDVLHWIDAGACLFFVADFLFEIVLHPRPFSWFCRNALTDLLPAVPSVFFLLPHTAVPAAAEYLIGLRALRLLRVTWAARYVQALRPLLRSARLLLFLVRGLDGLTARFSQLLNREFVFVPAAADVRRPVVEEDRRDLSYAALRREHELVALLPLEARLEVLQQRIDAVRKMAPDLGERRGERGPDAASQRDIPIDTAVQFLWTLRPQDIGRWLRPADVQSLDRVLRVLSAVPVRWLPIIRRFAVHPLAETSEERIVQLARRVAEWIESWHGRMLFFADLHGIVTGPQILDRVASAMVKASQRPAVRLLLFGGLFSILRLFWEDNFLSKIVGLPLVVLGGVCLVFLALGYWLKRLAGQASEFYRLTSEANFLSQLERVKTRYETEDLAFLARRIFGDGGHARQARTMLRAQVQSARTGVPIEDKDVPEFVRYESNRIALLYLHFLDGAPLHASDVKTTEQLLANPALENLRTRFLRFGPRERKRLRKLKLDDGSLLTGPYLWFRFITESIAVESAKRIVGYNRFCVPLAERDQASPAQLAAMQAWLERRRDPRGGRTIGELPWAARTPSHPTTEFTALDFALGDPERDRHLACLFGDEVLDVVKQDRRTMIREIFGTRPVHNLPKQERSFNPLRFYRRRLSHGRVLLAPLLLAWRFLRSVGWLIARVRQIVREVFDPDLAMQRREIGCAPFAVALRKIHRMKSPGLLEAIAMRLQLDPAYAGAPIGWSDGAPFAAEPEIERDLAFLHLREREAAELRDAAAVVRRHTAELHAALGWLPPFPVPGDDDARTAGELAVTCAWIADKDDARTLLLAERWRTEALPALLQVHVPRSWSRALWAAIRGLFVVHPVDRWLQMHGRGLPATARRPLRHAYEHDRRGVGALLDAWLRLPAGSSPAETAIACLRQAYRSGAAVRRDVLALRAVQSLAVLDVRNYRDLVFQLGDYSADGEDPQLGRALP